MNIKFEVNLEDALISFQRYKLNEIAYVFPNFSNVLVIGIEDTVEQLQKINIFSNFYQGLARCCDFPIKKERTKRAVIDEQISKF